MDESLFLQERARNAINNEWRELAYFPGSVPMSTILETHIWLDERGAAWIDDTNVKAIEVALDRVAGGLSPEETSRAHDGYLTMAQIHAALAYYYDHRAEFDAEIERQAAEFDDLRRKSLGTSVLREKLRALGKLP